MLVADEVKADTAADTESTSLVNSGTEDVAAVTDANDVEMKTEEGWLLVLISVNWSVYCHSADCSWCTVSSSQKHWHLIPSKTASAIWRYVADMYTSLMLQKNENIDILCCYLVNTHYSLIIASQFRLWAVCLLRVKRCMWKQRN